MEKKKPEWTLIQESKSPSVDKLYEVYKKDKYKARILYFNNQGQYNVSRVVKFARENGDFEICHFNEKIGISITNKMYRREKKVESIIYKGGKFWQITRGSKKCVQLTYSGLRSFIGAITSWNSVETHPIMKAFIKKFSWVRFISEETLLHGMAFNTIIRYKLYTQTDALKHKFKVPSPTIKTLKKCFKDYAPHDMIKVWKEMKQILINIENLKPELMAHHMFFDTCKMARTLNKKVNCSWGVKRLEQMHNDWSKEITNTVLEFEEFRNLKVAKVYHKFAEITGYKLLITNKELLYEGMMQKHCVATYINKVDSGRAGIYHINGYTLELNFANIFTSRIGIDKQGSTEHNYLSVIQFRGKYNKNAPIDLMIEIEEKVLAFNKGLATAHKCENDMTILTEHKPTVSTYDIDLNNIQEFEINQNVNLLTEINLNEIYNVVNLNELPF